MKYMTNNLATDEKPTRPNGQSVVLLSAVGGISLGGIMDDNIGLIIVGAIIAVMVLLWPVSAQAVEIDMEIIKRIESSGNTMAYNRESGAKGHHQITEICLVEFNRMNKTYYKSNDLFIPVVNEKIGNWYMNRRIPSMLKHYGIKDTVENRIIAYNAGIKAVKTGIIPKETRNYIRRYNRIKEAI